VEGYVVGYEGTLKVERTNEGFFVLNNIPAGQLDIIITGNDVGAGLWLDKKEKERGKRIKKTKILNGVKTDGGEIDLPRMGIIVGKAVLNGQTDHAGIDVYVPGTEYTAKTDTEGKFSFTAVPVGEHNLYFEKDGYHRGQIEGIKVAESIETKLDDLTLVLSTGAEGFIIIENGAALVNSRTVNLNIGATEDAVLMKISESNVFEGVSWKPVKSSLQYVFDSQGEKKLYVKFANANGLESSPFTDEVIVDIFSNGSAIFAPSYSVSSVVPPSSTFTLSNIALPGNATEMMVSTSSTFSGASWETPTTNKQIVFPANYSSCGTKKFYLKFKDSDGYESPTTSKSADLLCWESMSSSGAPIVSSGINGANGYQPNPLPWTGSEVLLVGYNSGMLGGNTIGAGAYNPETDTWRSLSTTGHTGTLFGYVSVLTNTGKLITWGGSDLDGTPLHSDGAIFSIGSNSWTPMSNINSPSARYNLSGIWTGETGNAITSNRLILWGGQSYSYPTDGFIYRADNDSWSSINSTNAPQARSSANITWASNNMIVWGGYSTCPGCQPINDGGLYDPSNDTWTATAIGPTARYGHAFVKTSDDEIFVWGGFAPNGLSVFADGMIFTPSTNSWRSISSTGAPLPRGNVAAVALDNGRVFVFGGQDAASGCFNTTGAIYDSRANTWTSVTYGDTALDRSGCAQYYLSWTGSKVVIWALDRGVIFSPF
jgi:N-acetylneuraminic acid mutarotase